MKSRHIDQYTIRNIPTALDRALRRVAQESGKSLNEVLLAALRRGASVGEDAVEHHDLDFLIGTWEEDVAVAAALAAQRVVDPEMWK